MSELAAAGAPRAPGPVLLGLALAAFSQHMPLLFLLVVVPSRMREEGTPLGLLGLFALVFIPFGLQFIWAPLIERTRSRCALSHRVLGAWRDWLIVTQLAAAALIFGLAAVPLSVAALPLLLPVMTVLALLAGSQKIASGALAIAHLSDPPIRAAGTSAMGLGSAVGSLAGTIGLVMLFSAHGWQLTLILAGSILFSTAALYMLIPRQAGPAAAAAPTLTPSLRRLARQPGFWPRLGRAALLAAPIGLVYGLTQPRLVDAGLDIASIGIVNGLGQTAMWLLVGPVMMLAIRKQGEVWALRGAVLVAASSFLAVGMATVILGNGLASAIASACAGLAALIAISAAAYTQFMRQAEAEGQPATDFSVYFSLYGLTIIAAAGLSGVLAQATGYGTVLLLAAGMALTAWRLVGSNGSQPGRLMA